MTDTLLGQTPWQTVGPYFHYALPWQRVGLLAAPDTAGERIALTGRVFDGAGQILPDAMVEIWQANAAGRYCHPDDTRRDRATDASFLGFGRSPTGENGVYRFETILPGRVPGPDNTLQAAHIAIGVFGRGLLRRLVTRAYFAGGDGLDEDPILARVPIERRATLIARPTDIAPAPPSYMPHVGPYVDPRGFAEDALPAASRVFVFDIYLQGPGETVFFDF